MESRTPSIGADHSDDRSYNSNDSAGSDHHWLSSREPSNSNSSHDSPHSRNENRSVRAVTGAEVDLLMSEPPVAHRDGSNQACEPKGEWDKSVLVRTEGTFLRDQTTRAQTELRSIFNAEEIKIEQMLDDEVILNAHRGLFGPSSSSLPRRPLVDETIDYPASDALGTGSFHGKKARYTKSRAPKKVVNKRSPKEIPNPLGRHFVLSRL